MLRALGGIHPPTTGQMREELELVEKAEAAVRMPRYPIGVKTVREFTAAHLNARAITALHST